MTEHSLQLIVLILLYALVCIGFLVLVIIELRHSHSSHARFHQPTTCTAAQPVKGRRTGLSEHATPFRQTERRAKQTLERPPDKDPPAGVREATRPAPLPPRRGAG